MFALYFVHFHIYCVDNYCSANIGYHDQTDRRTTLKYVYRLRVPCAVLERMTNQEKAVHTFATVPSAKLGRVTNKTKECKDSFRIDTKSHKIT